MNFEANRQKILESLQREKSRKKVSASRSASKHSGADPANVSSNGAQKVPVVIFGQKSPFIINLMSSLSSRCQPTLMNDVDTTCDFIVDQGVGHLILDIDPPSDYHLGVNLLSVVKSVSSAVKVFVCTKDIGNQRSRSLQDHGCVLLEKPVSTAVLFGYLI